MARADVEEQKRRDRVREILASVRTLAVEYYALTGKPLGVTGEVAEAVAAELLGLELVAARQAGFDAVRGKEKIQIKGRAFAADANRSQRIGKIKLDADCKTVMLVLLDNKTLEPREILEAPYAKVCKELQKPGSKSRERGALGVSAFRRISKKVWPPER